MVAPDPFGSPATTAGRACVAGHRRDDRHASGTKRAAPRRQASLRARGRCRSSAATPRGPRRPSSRMIRPGHRQSTAPGPRPMPFGQACQPCHGKRVVHIDPEPLVRGENSPRLGLGRASQARYAARSRGIRNTFFVIYSSRFSPRLTSRSRKPGSAQRLGRPDRAALCGAWDARDGLFRRKGHGECLLQDRCRRHHGKRRTRTFLPRRRDTLSERVKSAGAALSEGLGWRWGGLQIGFRRNGTLGLRQSRNSGGWPKGSPCPSATTYGLAAM